jgi:putative ABC transport system permease protein
MTQQPQSGSSHPTPSRSGMMMPRLLWRAITHRPAKLLTVIAALAVGATLASAFLSLYFDLPAKMTSEFRALGPNILVAPAEVAASSGTRPGDTLSDTLLDERTLPAARAAASGTEALPWLYAVGLVNKKTTVLAGTDTDRIAVVHPSWQITPVVPPTGSSSLTDRSSNDARGVFAGERAAAQHGWTAESADQQWIEIEYAGPEHQLPLKGIISTGGIIDDQLIVSLPALQEFTGHQGQLSAIEIAAPGDNARVEQTLAALQNSLGSAAAVRALRPVLESQARIIMKIRGLMFGLTAVVLALVLLSVMTTISGLVLDRSREIGIMKALGGSNARIMQFLMAETSLLALAAALTGYFAGFLLARAAARHIFTSTAESSLLTLRGDVFAVVVGITVAVALAACALPAQQMKRIDPAAILRGE